MRLNGFIQKILISFLLLVLAEFMVTPISLAKKTTQAYQHNHTNTTKKNTNSLTNQEIAKLLNWVPSNLPCQICGGYYLEPEIVREFPSPQAPGQEVSHISAKGPTIFRTDGVSILQKEVVVTQPGRVVKADKAYIYRKKRKITRIHLVGHVHFIESGKLMVSHSATLHLNDHSATLKNGIYHLHESTFKQKKVDYDAFGRASKIKRLANGVLELWHATYSTCAPVNPSWIIKAGYLHLDKKNGKGIAKNAVLYFKHIPVLYTPYYSFPIGKHRKSGFLTPTIGYNGKKNGLDITWPIYWNMAPNYDMTFSPRFMSKRGLQLNDLFRYLSPSTIGSIYLSFLPNDREFKKFKTTTIATNSNDRRLTPYVNQLRTENNYRGFAAVRHHTVFDPNWSFNAIGNYVTDPYYFRDFGNYSGIINADQLFNQIDVDYSGLHWSFILLTQAYQTLHRIDLAFTNPVQNQYTRAPEFDFNGNYPDIFGGVNFVLSGQVVNFLYHSTFNPQTFQKPLGQRVHLLPSFSRPFVWAQGYITPTLALDSTFFNAELATPLITIPRGKLTADRNIPIFDIDSGLYFDRDFHFRDHDYTQTLEPRIFYLFVPLIRQNKYPVFDTYNLPFTYAQLFAANRFTGFDRIQNANQAAFGLTSRILDAETAQEILKAQIGFIYYFSQPRVTLPGATPSITPPIFFILSEPRHNISPIVSQLTYYPTQKWAVSGTVAYDVFLNQVSSTSVSLLYTHDQLRIISLGYEFVHIPFGYPTVDSTGLSTNTQIGHLGLAWPLTNHWSTLGYIYYNIGKRRPQTYFAGLAYDTCCWAIRFIVARNFTGTTTAPSGAITNQYRTAYYVQFQLKGLGSYGNSDPSHLLAIGIPGLYNQFEN